MKMNLKKHGDLAGIIFTFCLLTVSCSRDDTDISSIGYYPKTIHFTYGVNEMDFKLEYNDQNQLIREDVKFTTDDFTLGYAYNDAAKLTETATMKWEITYEERDL